MATFGRTLRRRLRAALPHLGLVACLAFLLAPLAWLLAGVAREALGGSGEIARLLARRDAGGRIVFVRQLLNSLEVAGLTTVLAMAIGVPAGWACARFRFPARRITLVLASLALLAPMTLFVAPALELVALIRRFESTAMLVPIDLAAALPAVLLLSRQAFASVPRSLLDAATLEGGPPWRTFWNVGLPTARASLGALAAVLFALVWGEHFAGSALVAREAAQTIPVALATLLQGRGQPFGVTAAALLLGSLPAFVAALAGGRRVVELVGAAVSSERVEA
jgi:ABC-type glycerol-3-phosphate transport system permease component